MAVGDAALHCSAGPVDFCSFSGSGFGEHGHQDDDSSGGDVVADSGWLSIEVEPQFAEFAVELAGEWFAEVYALVGEEIDVAFGLTELVVGEGVEPVGNLGFQFYCSPKHSSDAITLARGGVSALSEDSERVMAGRRLILLRVGSLRVMPSQMG